MTLPTVLVDIGFTSPTVGDVFTVGDDELGQVGVYPLGDPDVWTDVTPYVKSWSVRRGATRGDDPTLRYEAGTATVILHDGDRRFDPENLDGPHVSAGVSQVEPMRRVRIRAVWDGITYPLFQGFSDDFQPDYQGNNWTYTTVTATDAFKVFSAYEREAVAPTAGGQNSGNRVTLILNGIGWPANMRAVSQGNTLLQETTLAGNALTELQLTQDSEMGEFYIDAMGRAVFRNRRAILTQTRSKVSQALFGDGGYDATGEIPYADAKPSTGDEGMANSVSIAREGGTAQLSEDVVSISRYLTKSHQRHDLIVDDDATSAQIAAAIRYQFSMPARRFASLDFRTPRDEVADVSWPQILGREFADRITIVRRPAGGGTPISRQCFVRGVSHASDGADWSTSWVLQSADRYAYLTIGDATMGRIGYNAVSY